MIKMINFIDTSSTEKELILEWRNNPLIKSVMHNTLDISSKEHLEFIKCLKYKDDKKYFLIKINDQYIGVIDYINISQSGTEFGIYSNPNIKGYGKKLMNTLCQYAFNKLKVDRLIAEVYSNNDNAIRLYKTFNFLEFKRQTDETKEIIYMELLHENWRF
jgi:UDP-4-amino-4,6-dideoxy-N-acetyl-beta-L-altrosamine N-acetyltransferase